MRREISGAALLIGLMAVGARCLDAATYQAEDAALSGKRDFISIRTLDDADAGG